MNGSRGRLVDQPLMPGGLVGLLVLLTMAALAATAFYALLVEWGQQPWPLLATVAGIMLVFVLLLAIPLYRHQLKSRDAEHRLRSSEQQLRRIIDLVPHFIFAKNGRGEFLLANQAMADAYGTT